MARAVRKKSLVIEVPDDVPVSGGGTSRKRVGTPSPTVSVMGFFLFLALGAAGYFYYQYSHTSQIAEAREIKELSTKIGKVVALPDGEVPTLATVTNKEKLDNQPFFQKAENGDKILIYSTAGKVVLYRPSVGKVIDMTTVSVTKEAPPETVTPETPPAPETPVVEPVPETIVTPPSDTTEMTQPPAVTTPLPITVALYNGSTKVGVTSILETELKTKFPDLVVTTKEKAVKNDYVGTLVVDLSLKNVDLAKNLAESIGGTVGLLPLGEAVPTADIVIIIGKK